LHVRTITTPFQKYLAKNKKYKQKNLEIKLCKHGFLEKGYCRSFETRNILFAAAIFQKKKIQKLNRNFGLKFCI